MSRGAAQVVRHWWNQLDPEASDQRMAFAFALLAGGAMMAVLGVIVVAFGDLVLPRPSWIREMGFVAAAGGLPVFLSGLAVALPSRWWERTLVASGMIACAGALALFVLLYPHRWHLTIQTPNGYAIGSYLIGMSFMAAGTAGCLGTYIVEQAEAATAAKRERDQRDWSDEEIQRDIRWAEKQGWGWGGVRTGKVDEELHLKEEVEPIQFLGGGPDVVETTESGELDVTNARALANMRGVQPKNTDDDTLDSQVGNLKQLKQKRRAEESRKRESWTWKLTHPFQWLGGS